MSDDSDGGSSEPESTAPGGGIAWPAAQRGHTMLLLLLSTERNRIYKQPPLNPHDRCVLRPAARPYRKDRQNSGFIKVNSNQLRFEPNCPTHLTVPVCCMPPFVLYQCSQRHIFLFGKIRHIIKRVCGCSRRSAPAPQGRLWCCLITLSELQQFSQHLAISNSTLHGSISQHPNIF